MQRLQGKGKDAVNWWNAFQTAKYPAYVTLVNPASIPDLDKPRSRVKHVLLDDVLDCREYKSGLSPPTIEVKEGSFVLVLPDNASTARAHCVSPPWLCRVNSIWFVPGDRGSSHGDPKGTLPEVQDWESTQIEQSRIAAQHFELQVTYFYRWPDLYDAVKEYPNNILRLSQALQNLGIADNDQQVRALLNKRGCGNTPATHFGMRYVTYSNHDSTAPSDDTDGTSSDIDEDNSPVPMESVMGTAKVLFLDSNAKLPYLPSKAPAAAAAAFSTVPKSKAALPAAERQALAARSRCLVPGFVCNMFLVTPRDEAPGAKLFGLSEWAKGTAGANLNGSWVAKSRKQVHQLLQDTKAELQAAQAAAQVTQQQRQQQQGGRSAVAAVGNDDSNSQQTRPEEQEDVPGLNDDVDSVLLSTENLATPDREPTAATATRTHAGGHLGSIKGSKAAAAAAARGVKGRVAVPPRRHVVVAELSSEEDDEEEEDEGQELHREDETARRHSSVRRGISKGCKAAAAMSGEDSMAAASTKRRVVVMELSSEDGEEEEEEEEEPVEEENDQVQSELEGEGRSGVSSEGQGEDSHDEGEEEDSQDEGEEEVVAAAAAAATVRKQRGDSAPWATPATVAMPQHSSRTRSHPHQQQQQPHHPQSEPQHGKARNSSGRQKCSSGAGFNTAGQARKRQKRNEHSEMAAGDSDGSGIVVIDV